MRPTPFFLDIDGTLLRGRMAVPETVKAAAGRFRDAGGVIVLCTGRSTMSTRHIARELNLDAPAVLFNGAALYDFKNETASDAVPLPARTADLLAPLTASYPEASLQAHTLERAYLLRLNELLASRGVREELEPEVSSTAEVGGDILKLVMSHPDPDVLRRCREEYFSEPGYNFMFASRHFIEVVAEGVDKGTGARAALRRLGLSGEAAFAAGDAMTDLPMFGAAAYSFAPADAMPEVAAACDEIIPSCEEGGMERAFESALRLMRSAEWPADASGGVQ